MRLHHDQLLLSATDLSNHLACRHKTTLDRAQAEGTKERPHRADPALERLQQRGLDHERAYVEHLRAQGRTIVELRDVEGADAAERTRRAMHDGADVIVQAALVDGIWSGRADLLLKVAGKSELGDWLYEVADTKLARETRGTTLLQLCVYADLLAPIQGLPAPRMHVVKPGAGFPCETFRFAEYAAYYRTRRARLARELDAPSPTYPEPVDHCDVCAWWPDCRQRRVDDDHLSLVADLTTAHAREFERQGRRTLEALATSPTALDDEPRHGRIHTYEKLREQAAIQLEGRLAKAPRHALLPFAGDRGFARLPVPGAGDVYLDFEGDPFVDEGGLEYVLGYAARDAGGAMRYEALWGKTRAAERAAFERFVDFVLARLDAHPGLHIYHFAPYEPAALKRLASRHATRERELDRLLRGERFVDLHAITRQALRASVERYSLKPLEKHFAYDREVDLREEASPALQRVNAALEYGAPEEITPEDARAVEGYNRDDCLSLVKLQAWLEDLRAESCPHLDRPPVKPCEESEAQESAGDRVKQLFDALTDGLDPDERPWSAEGEARWLLAHTLEYFHRERRVDWWEYFARRDAEDDELRKDRKAIVGLEFVGTVDHTAGRLPIDRYTFPEQEVGLDEKDDLQDARFEPPEGEHPPKLGKVEAIELVGRTIDIRKTKKTRNDHPAVIHDCGRVPTRPLPGALHDLAEWIVANGLDSPRPEHRAARDLLLRLPPRRPGDTSPLKEESEDLLAAQVRAARALDGGVLAVQGPPGTGKSYTGARVILHLLRAGKRVGVCATSHKVIRSLLEKVLEAPRKDGGPPASATHKISSRHDFASVVPDGLTETKENDDVLAAAAGGEVVGGVSWTWARPDAEGALDYLVVDEAGQLSLAYVLAIARSTRNLILLGDPQQLQQPQRGAHPEGADVSALSHLLGEHRTMPTERGLFLDRTWRLHPGICAYTSELFYERRLGHHPKTARQALVGPTAFAGSGLWFVPAEHEGHQSHAPEEIELVASLVESLVAGEVHWTDFDGASAPLTAEDVLIIAPYNLQVSELRRRLPDFSVGTVDKFQGQEAAVVVYSLTSSSPEDAPRGMSFLYDLHRLNVATSRGRAACIVVGSPRLLEPECRSPEQMRLANGLASYIDACR